MSKKSSLKRTTFHVLKERNYNTNACSIAEIEKENLFGKRFELKASFSNEAEARAKAFQLALDPYAKNGEFSGKVRVVKEEVFITELMDITPEDAKAVVMGQATAPNSGEIS